MNKQFRFTALLVVCVFATAAWAQQDEPALPPSADTEETEQELPASQEVEINEDNYRQFMELKDGLQQRTVLPENSYQSQAGLQKLDKLPEESQKHLRNQLREIIMQRGPWQPGDEDGEYPYVPSGAASTDAALQKQEAEAWGELVGHYHAREADIYAGSPRARAAGGAGGNSATGGNEGQDGKGQNNQAGGNEGQGNDERDSEGQGSAAQSAGQRSASGQDSTEGSYSPGSASDPNATNTEGVSQNAMEFLMQSGNLGANAGQNSAAATGGSDGQAGEQEQMPGEQASTAQMPGEPMAGKQSSGEQAAGTQTAQQSDSEQAQAMSTQAMSIKAMQTPTNQAETESTAGTSQNALEYLVGKDAPNETDTPDTLSIEDLVNARGVSVELGVDSTGGDSGEEEIPDESKPKKDGDG